MYFWKVDQLVDDFRENRVSEKEKFKYMLVMGIIFTIISDPILWIGTRYTAMDTINLFLMISVVVWGTYHCYVSNQNGDDEDFISRFACVGLPVSVRLITVGIPIFLTIGIMEEIYNLGIETDEYGTEYFITTTGQIIASLIFAIVFYLYLGRKLKSIGSKHGAEPGSSADTRA